VLDVKLFITNMYHF